MEDLYYVYATAGVIVLYFLAQVVTRRFDPFAPTWLFLVGYIQVYVIQAISYHDWAVGVRGKELVAAANWRAFWSLVWFLAVYHLGLGRRIVRVLPRPPRSWSPLFVASLSPPLILWGLICSGMVLRIGDGGAEADVGREVALPLVPVRADGGRDPPDRDGPEDRRAPARIPGGRPACARPLTY